jgi:hypothetical protein
MRRFTGVFLGAAAGTLLVVAGASVSSCAGGGFDTSEPTPYTCPEGTIDCDGICVDPMVDSNNCGACGTKCEPGYACDGSGSCALACQEGLVSCDGNCIDPLTSPQFCGAAADCVGANAGVACDAGEVCDGSGSCAVSCQAGMVACDGICTDPLTSVSHCGAGADCATEPGTACGAGEVCDGTGHCALSCSAGLTECDDKCVDPQVDEAHCGAGADCGANPGTACAVGELCALGQCKLNCQAGYVDCYGSCVNPLTDGKHCGAGADCLTDPGVACKLGEVCDGQGTCALSCQIGLVNCAGVCTNPLTDESHCGAATDCDKNPGVACGPGTVCKAGSCAPSCAAGLTICNNQCVDTDWDPAYCGSCTKQCTASESCVSGKCVPKPAPCNPWVLFSDSFANAGLGWTLGTQWQIGPAVASTCAGGSTGNDPATDHTPTADNGVAGIAIGGCYGTAIHGAYCLTSPVVDISAATGSVYFSYYRHLHTDYPSFISSYTQVFNGTSWVTVYDVPCCNFVNDASWAYQQFDVTAHKNANFQVRFCYSSGPSSGIIDGGGWSVDDVVLHSCL